MLRIEQISLTQFKNHPDISYPFRSRVVGITGSNGAGKTNLLDAIHTLCFSRGYFSRSDLSLVKHGLMGCRLDGNFLRHGQIQRIAFIIRENGKKEIWQDDDLLPRVSDHLGRFPVVMIAPDDSELITGESRNRRQFLDALISQLTPGYLTALVKYNRILQERQALLRACAEQGYTEGRKEILQVLEQQMADSISVLIPARRLGIQLLEEKMLEQYRWIAGSDEGVEMEYQTEMLPGDPLEQLRLNRARDLAAQRNTIGPHRDDLLWKLGGHPFRQIASQGQRKTLLFALKLAERALLEEKLGIPPILLLDDVFEKLDPSRMKALLQWVAHQTDSQVFITDTDPERLRSQLDELQADWQWMVIQPSL